MAWTADKRVSAAVGCGGLLSAILSNCARADTGDGYAAERLADLLAERHDADELRARADTCDEVASWRLADLLTEQGRGEEAEQLRRFGLNLDGSIASA